MWKMATNLLLLACIGCGPTLRLTVTTEPDTAKIYRDHEDMGQGKVVMKYDSMELVPVNGYTGLWVAHWPGGEMRAAALSVEKDEEAGKRGCGYEFSGTRGFVFEK